MTPCDAIQWALQLVTIEASLASLEADRKEALACADELAKILRRDYPAEPKP